MNLQVATRQAERPSAAMCITRLASGRGPLAAALQHWPEYLIETIGLGLFVLSACLFITLLEHPDSPVRQTVTEPMLRRIPMGLAMGLTAVGLIYSPWGQRSGAHFNPSVTLTFWRLGKVAPWDAVFYVAAQFIGAIAGVGVAATILEARLAYPSVSYAATVPRRGAGIAFVAEFVISFVLMTVVLTVSNSPRFNRFTGLCAGVLITSYIVFEAPLSGMSMNAARTVGSALYARAWMAIWVYFTAPLLGMLSAAQLYVRIQGAQKIFCAKLHHHNAQRCIFRCDYAALAERNAWRV
jgi:aquaporin Z